MRVRQATLLQFFAENILRCGGEVVDLVREVLDLDVAHFAVELGKTAPFLSRVCLHGEQYSAEVESDLEFCMREALIRAALVESVPADVR
jgi:hypothetical protein